MITEEQKKLLIKDLSARVPYDTWVLMETEGSDDDWKTRLQHDYCLGYISGKITRLYFHEITFKPYLRPLSSMTEEEINEFILISDTVLWLGNKRSTCILSLEQMDFFNAHHFDYRGLIEMGLALEAPDGLYDGRISDTEFLQMDGKSSTVR